MWYDSFPGSKRLLRGFGSFLPPVWMFGQYSSTSSLVGNEKEVTCSNLFRKKPVFCVKL